MKKTGGESHIRPPAPIVVRCIYFFEANVPKAIDCKRFSIVFVRDSMVALFSASSISASARFACRSAAMFCHFITSDCRASITAAFC